MITYNTDTWRLLNTYKKKKKRLISAPQPREVNVVIKETIWTEIKWNIKKEYSFKTPSQCIESQN